jgi:dethiobiotin synthetase
MDRLVISGIGTGVGKTVVSAIFSEALKAHYWKPVQSGDLHDLDSMKVARLAPSSTILPERYKLSIPVSPHYAAEHDGITLTMNDFILSEVMGNLVIEGAGGLMVPMDYNGLLYIDIFQKWGLPVVLVSRHYLGSINHTLLSVEALKSHNIPIWGIVFVGDEHLPTEKVIANVTGIQKIFRIPEVAEVTTEFVLEQAERLRTHIDVGT